MVPMDKDPGHVPWEDLTAAYLEPLLSNAIVMPTPAEPRHSITVAKHNGAEYCLQTSVDAQCATWKAGQGPEDPDPSLASLRICKDCRAALDNGRAPKVSLVTLDIGTVDDALRRNDIPASVKNELGALVELTMIEQDLISWVRGQCKMTVCRGSGYVNACVTEAYSITN